MAWLIENTAPFPTDTGEYPGTFYALTRAIVFQQLHDKAASSIFGRLRALFPAGELRPEQILQTDEPILRGVGLSRNKQLAIQDLARFAVDGRLPDAQQLKTLDDDSIVSLLTEIRGIGPWTVHMLLIFRLGRPDVWPVGDLAIRNGYGLLHDWPEPPTAKQLQPLGDCYRPYRSVASWYLWRANEKWT